MSGASLAPGSGLTPREALAALGEVLAEHPKIAVMSDEIYEHIQWAVDPYASFAAVCPRLYDRTVTINGVSKAYAMTGWRGGDLWAPGVDIGVTVPKMQDQMRSGITPLL